MSPVASVQTNGDVEALSVSPKTMQDGIWTLQHAFSTAVPPPRWPMYVRQVKQFLRNAVEGFDERHYGFTSVVDLLRAAGKEGVLRVERDRQGAVRVFAGPKVTPAAAPGPIEQASVEDVGDVEDVEAVVVADAGVVVDLEHVTADLLVADLVIEEPPDGQTTQDAAAIAAAGIVGGGSIGAGALKRTRRRGPGPGKAAPTVAAKSARSRSRRPARPKTRV